MDNPKARLYLDNDGCIRIQTAGSAWPEYCTAQGSTRRGRQPRQPFQTTWSPNLIDALRHLTEAHSVELVWLSSWNEHLWITREFAPVIGWGSPARVAPYMADENSSDPEGFTRWKADFVIMDSRDNVPFIWVDDDAVADHSADVRQMTSATPSLLLAPEEHRGITPAMITQIEAFLEQL